MLVKYLGLVWDDKLKQNVPRTTFLNDGLFRFTQPKFLNDKGSEARFDAYYDEYSAVDIEWAKTQYLKQSIDFECTMAIDKLIAIFLEPTGCRFGDCMPWLVKETGFETMAEYDYNTFEKGVLAMNHAVIELLSAHVGVFSLCKSDSSVYMWTHYASEGKGIAVVFKEDHSFFKDYPAKGVSYNREDRATISYQKGLFRINGHPAENFKVVKSDTGKLSIKLPRNIDWEELTNRLIYSKDANPWLVEEEMRIVLPLDCCDVGNGKILTPELDESLVYIPNLTDKKYSEVCLKKIPLDAVESIIVGFDTDPTYKQVIIDKLASTAELSHINIKQVQYNVFNKLEVVDI
ncbi:DUF2971 domain-containing protein [Vibrio ezurae]|uniref:DUF2971 domain-containing protein n=1 Tax=Vibrio ezurae NBRC 102218 TaxID=1219080 RepID=U3B053_9VIBR|nr:DUF2971 domain-containing protein [Vibrio ezurae]GAD79350.1 hypothetical protein VEZ01S_10_00290 [Vibrio ezurae NBRC 102218]